ncbi:MAG: hypothetical protein MZW92_13375 [Comamonadaceae bacterium]|nr:hypothetical protein [Comamonadaceae bacterium]
MHVGSLTGQAAPALRSDFPRRVLLRQELARPGARRVRPGCIWRTAIWPGCAKCVLLVRRHARGVRPLGAAAGRRARRLASGRRAGRAAAGGDPVRRPAHPPHALRLSPARRAPSRCIIKAVRAAYGDRGQAPRELWARRSSFLPRRQADPGDRDFPARDPRSCAR